MQQLLPSLLAVHIETDDLEGWKQHLRFTGIKFRTDSEEVLTALHEATGIAYSESLSFLDPLGLCVRLLRAENDTAPSG